MSHIRFLLSHLPILDKSEVRRTLKWHLRPKERLRMIVFFYSDMKCKGRELIRGQRLSTKIEQRCSWLEPAQKQFGTSMSFLWIIWMKHKNYWTLKATLFTNLSQWAVNYGPLSLKTSFFSLKSKEFINLLLLNLFWLNLYSINYTTLGGHLTSWQKGIQ